MGDLQGEFDFFIKNQQPTEEKKKSPPSPLAIALPFHGSFFLKCRCQTLPPHFLPILPIIYIFFLPS